MGNVSWLIKIGLSIVVSCFGLYLLLTRSGDESNQALFWGLTLLPFGAHLAFRLIIGVEPSHRRNGAMAREPRYSTPEEARRRLGPGTMRRTDHLEVGERSPSRRAESGEPRSGR